MRKPSIFLFFVVALSCACTKPAPAPVPDAQVAPVDAPLPVDVTLAVDVSAVDAASDCTIDRTYGDGCDLT